LQQAFAALERSARQIYAALLGEPEPEPAGEPTLFTTDRTERSPLPEGSRE